VRDDESVILRLSPPPLFRVRKCIRVIPDRVKMKENRSTVGLTTRLLAYMVYNIPTSRDGGGAEGGVGFTSLLPIRNIIFSHNTESEDHSRVGAGNFL